MLVRLLSTLAVLALAMPMNAQSLADGDDEPKVLDAYLPEVVEHKPPPQIEQLKAYAGLQTGHTTEEDCDACPEVSCCEESGSLYAGYAFAFMKPHFKESFQAITINPTNGLQSLIGYKFEHDLTPRMWLGYQSASGAGIRGRYWQYDNASDPLQLTAGPNIVSAQAVTVIFPGVIASPVPGDVLVANSALDVETIDVEGTQAIQLGELSGIAGVGIRYARLKQTNDARIIGALPQQLTWERVLEGLGPMLSIEMLRPIGESGLSAFGSARGAVLFGSKTMRRSVSSLPVPTFPPVIVMDGVDEVSGVFEMDLGLQMTRRISLGDLVVRGAFEGQLWTDAGAPTLTFLGFEGFTVSIGLTR